MNLHDGMGKISGVWVGFGGVVRLTYYNCTTTEMKGGGGGGWWRGKTDMLLQYYNGNEYS